MKHKTLNLLKQVNIIGLLFILIFLNSCKDKKNVEHPEWLVEKESMISFLIDLHVVEAKLIKLGIKKDSSRQLFEVYQKELFEKHNIDDSIYFLSYNYYLEEIGMLREIYGAVVDSMNVKQQLIKQNDNKPEK